MNHIKNKKRNLLNENSLNDLLMLSLNGKELEFMNFNDAIDYWKTGKGINRYFF